jgi:hypothetical protein
MNHVGTAAPFDFAQGRLSAVRSSEGRQCRTTDPESILSAMDKKEIESPKLTTNFLFWISAFMLLLFALLAHFVWKVF